MTELVEISIINNTAYEKLNFEFDKIVKIGSNFSKKPKSTHQNKITIDKTEDLEGLLSEIISLREGSLKVIKDVVNMNRNRKLTKRRAVRPPSD